MGLTVEHLQGRLARFEFEALFLADLGWESPIGRASGSPPGFSGIVNAIASQGQGTVVEVTQGDLTELSPPLFFSALDRLADTYADPLVIWQPGGEGSNPGQRSLWCWLGGEPTAPHWHTQVVIAGEASPAWARRLLRLHREGWTDRDRLYTALNPLGTPPSPDLIEGFQLSWQSLGQAMGEISSGEISSGQSAPTTPR
ncbi:MAG: hypothetical protein HC929_14525 [Leptolyngbyaceae cyanobacterium SM2_5_2]|nr:hypothetical protein [Leptolyngbyaceae cyanobacterium SM2_5_2]